MKVNIALLTVTDTRTFGTDKSGAILVEKIKKANHNLVDRKICKDNKNEIIKILNQWTEKKEIDVIVTTGGTGLPEEILLLKLLMKLQISTSQVLEKCLDI